MKEMEVILPVHGRLMAFSKQELIAILEKHFSNEATEQKNTAKVAQPPTEGKWFKVNPLSINPSLFQEKRRDKSQEKTRKLIPEAFAEVKSNPEKYGKNFKTMIPKKTWPLKTVEQLKEMACRFGDHNADWVEQALEWAQRIANGESWEAICNDKDTANWYRLVVWKNGYARLVGGSDAFYNDYPVSDVSNYNCNDNHNLCNTVPLVVLYE